MMSRAGPGADALDVSRETYDCLQTFADLVEKWTPRINLVSKASLAQFWDRHIRDSLQLLDVAPPTGSWVDMGSGGGFPGLVIAIALKDQPSDRTLTLIESDQRKCAFLRTVIRDCDLTAQVIPDRIETAPAQKADILSARALATLPRLLDLSSHHAHETTLHLYPKGKNWREEVDAARNDWRFDCQPVISKTNPDAVILRITGVQRV